MAWGDSMVMDGDLPWGGEHTDDVMWNCAPENCIILLTSVTPVINSVTKKSYSSTVKNFKLYFNLKIKNKYSSDI